MGVAGGVALSRRFLTTDSGKQVVHWPGVTCDPGNALFSIDFNSQGGALMVTQIKTQPDPSYALAMGQLVAPYTQVDHLL
jgi:hypothetical protein